MFWSSTVEETHHRRKLCDQMPKPTLKVQGNLPWKENSQA